MILFSWAGAVSRWRFYPGIKKGEYDALWFDSISHDNFSAVSYDVNKDGAKVAVLTFVKSAFRLAETAQCSDAQ